MANPYRGEVDVLVYAENDEVKKYRVCFDANTICELEQAMGGVGINELIKDKFKQLDSFTFRRLALYHGLQRDPNGRKLSLKQVGNIVGLPCGKDIHWQVLRALFLAMGWDIEAAKAKQEAAIAAGKDPDEIDPLAPTESSDPESQSVTGLDSK